MGNRFTSSTWRAPIQLIDSWLPIPASAVPLRNPSKVVQLFTRAGWLNRPAANTTFVDPAPELLISTQTPSASRPRHVRILRTHGTASGCRTDARLVISGRINDVCAELDRLATLEHRQTQHG